MPDCIRTFSGLYMNVMEPTEEMICIEDIAHALSHQCRFAGHLSEFYSVAQHSWMCAQVAEEPDKLAGLLHDASEAYLLDIPSPIKKHLSNYKEIEDRLMRLIAKKFGFEYPLSDHIKRIDAMLLEQEWKDYVLRESPDAPRPFTHAWAKSKFLNLFSGLTAKIPAEVPSPLLLNNEDF